jgi:hypothetical protein
VPSIKRIGLLTPALLRHEVMGEESTDLYNAVLKFSKISSNGCHPLPRPIRSAG